MGVVFDPFFFWDTPHNPERTRQNARTLDWTFHFSSTFLTHWTYLGPIRQNTQKINKFTQTWTLCTRFAKNWAIFGCFWEKYPHYGKRIASSKLSQFNVVPLDIIHCSLHSHCPKSANTVPMYNFLAILALFTPFLAEKLLLWSKARHSWTSTAVIYLIEH